jgi:hypothetical protein
MPRWPWSRKRAYVDPGSPHVFRQTDDAGLSSMASRGGGRVGPGGGLSQVILAANLQRDQSRCGVPGCGRERSDPIHDPARR